jgi:hypothetical protein
MLPSRLPGKMPTLPLRLRRRPLASYTQAGCAFMFLIPHMLMGVLFPLSVLVHRYVRWYGTPIQVIVDGKDTHESSKSHSLSYSISYHYTIGEYYQDKVSVGAIDYSVIQRWQALPAHTTNLLSWRVTVTELEDGENYWVVAGFFVVWWTFIGAVLLPGPILRAKQRHLLRRGVPTAGTITGRQAVGGKQRRYFLMFCFHTSSGKRIQQKMRVSHYFYEIAQDGEQVTVIYKNDKPGQCLVYDYCEYEDRTWK